MISSFSLAKHNRNVMQTAKMSQMSK